MFNDFFQLTTSTLALLFLINFGISLMIIFLEKKDPTSTLAWIMVLFLIPFVGIFLYLIFSQNLSKKKIFRYTALEKRIMEASLKLQIDQLQSDEFEFKNEKIKSFKNMIYMHQVHSNSMYSEDNTVDVFTNGYDKFTMLLQDIQRAKSHIHIMYFIIQKDALGLSIINALTKKAKEGLEVRLLLDAFGSKNITLNVLKEYMDAGGKVSYFFPSKIKFLNLKLNYRNHRKLVIIDGQIGYIGGFNIGDEYLGKKRLGFWRDTHIRIMGSAVHDLQTRFILDWRSASKENLNILMGYYSEPISYGDCGIQIVSSGPDSVQQQIKFGYLNMITSARKNIYIQTPYFIPDQSIQESLKVAALSGIDVQIMIPCKPDHFFVYWATYFYIGELIQAGVKVYLYNPGFLHAKTICIDGIVGSIGTANFDIRSFALNFESNAFIYSSTTVPIMENIFLNDVKDCTELTEQAYRSRSSYIKFHESISRLISNIL